MIPQGFPWKLVEERSRRPAAAAQIRSRETTTGAVDRDGRGQEQASGTGRNHPDHSGEFNSSAPHARFNPRRKFWGLRMIDET